MTAIETFGEGDIPGLREDLESELRTIGFGFRHIKSGLITRDRPIAELIHLSRRLVTIWGSQSVPEWDRRRNKQGTFPWLISHEIGTELSPKNAPLVANLITFGIAIGVCAARHDHTPLAQRVQAVLSSRDKEAAFDQIYALSVAGLLSEMSEAVELPNESGNESGQTVPDLLCSKDSHRFWIECKRVSQKPSTVRSQWKAAAKQIKKANPRLPAILFLEMSPTPDQQAAELGDQPFEGKERSIPNSIRKEVAAMLSRSETFAWAYVTKLTPLVSAGGMSMNRVVWSAKRSKKGELCLPLNPEPFGFPRRADL